MLNPEGDKVLLARYLPGLYGLPGGHIDNDEHPDEAMARELKEELGLSDVTLRRGSFTRHENGKIVLFYTGILSEDTRLQADPSELEAGEWVNIEQISSDKISLGDYKDFTLETANDRSASR